MPFFKKKEDRSVRIEELEAHVRNIRRIAAEDPKGAGALQSFLVEDGFWDSKAAELEARSEAEHPAPQKPPPQPKHPPAPAPEAHHSAPAGPPVKHPTHSPEANMVTAQNVEQLQPLSEDEAMLEAELKRYLERIAEETEPDDDSAYMDEYRR
jgi:hypothetical protein